MSGANIQTQSIRMTLLAMLPALLCSTFFAGFGVLSNLVTAATASVLALGLLQWARCGRSTPADLGSALITAAILAFALPQASPPWLAATAALSATLFRAVMHASVPPSANAATRAGSGGGDRRVVFNPAMVGFAFVVLLFPHALVYSPTDGSTGATALIAMAQRAPETISELRAHSAAFGRWSGAGSEWLGITWMLGGLFLLWRRVTTWQAPLGCVVGVSIAAAAGYDGDSAYGGATAIHHLLSGGTLLVAWFVLTDPGTAPRLPLAQLISGLCAGALLYAARESGGGADRSAFVVLLVNASAGAFDALAHWLQGRYARHRSAGAPAASTDRVIARARSSTVQHHGGGVLLGAATMLALAFLTTAVEWRYGTLRSSQSAARELARVQGLVFPFGQPPDHAALHFRQLTAPGYGGPIVLALALDRQRCIRGIAALRHSESSGVGAPLLTPAIRQVASAVGPTGNGWLQQWLAACPIAQGSQAADAIDNVTGATLTSRATATALASWRKSQP